MSIGSILFRMLGTLIAMILLMNSAETTLVVADKAECQHVSCTWEIDFTSYNKVIGYYFERYYCDECGIATDERMQTIALHQGTRFILTPVQFEERLKRISYTLSENYDIEHYDIELKDMDGEIAITMYDKDENLVAIIQFTDEKEMLTLKGNTANEERVSCVMVYIYSENVSDWIGVTMTTMLTCDNTLEVPDASDILKTVVLSGVDGDNFRHNDIGYAFGEVGEYKLFVASLLK